MVLRMSLLLGSPRPRASHPARRRHASIVGGQKSLHIGRTADPGPPDGRLPGRRSGSSVLDPPFADDGVVAVGAVLPGTGDEIHLLHVAAPVAQDPADLGAARLPRQRDRKSTRLNSSHT